MTSDQGWASVLVTIGVEIVPVNYMQISIIRPCYNWLENVSHVFNETTTKFPANLELIK